MLESGYGTIAPGLDYRFLVEELSRPFWVVIIEPLGYGDSEGAGTPRTLENISDEFHSVVKALGTGNYILCSHSISGIYSIYYMNRYPGEVKGFVGLDTSVPNQLKYIDNTFSPVIRRLASELGLIGWATVINRSWLIADEDYYPEDLKDQIKYRLYRDFPNDTSLDEGEHFETNWEKVKNLQYPKDIEKLFFLSKKESREKHWRYLETVNVIGDDDSLIYLMEGSHYIYRENYKEIAEIIIDEFGA